jgi:hypothetical protein
MKQRERATHTVTFMHRGNHELGNGKSLSDLLDVMDEYEAKDAGLTLAEWESLPESEQIRFREDYLDRQYASGNNRALENYRTVRRALIEASELEKEFGFPQWLRDQYAKERPAEIVVEYLGLLTEGATADGEALQEILRKIDARTGRGFIGTELPFAEARERLLEEIDRVGLGEFFREAEAQQRERANQ